MSGARGPDWKMALAGGLLLAIATPPAVAPGAEFLVLAGLAAWFAIATAAARPYLASYLLGCVHMAWFSWSVRHVLFGGWAAIVALGGLYFVAGTAAVRAVSTRAAPLTFGVAAAASFWLRAHMPEIWYPHGQPCHCLWQWPALLGGLRIGGEPIVNALLAALAAGWVLVWRSWRTGEPRWGAAAWWAGGTGAIALAVTCAGIALAPPPARTRLAIAAIEPGLHSFDPFHGLSSEQRQQRLRELIEERLRGPTWDVLGSASPPDLVLWPESALPLMVPVDEIEGGMPLVPKLALPPGQLLFGANVGRGAGATPAALLVDLPGGTLRGRHEKQRLVPGGEFLPFVSWLPSSIATAVHEAFAAALGSPPDCVAGEPQPLLQTRTGVRFGALLCYDNAFVEPAASQVGGGAQFLCVLSNESWYRGGGELVQLAAMTVCRAIELATPFVRCTTDGWSLAIGADGRILAQLPIRGSPQPTARILRVDLPLGSGQVPPMAWLRTTTGPAAALLLAAALLHGLWRWARLRTARTNAS